MILRRLDPTQSPNGNGSRWPKAHRVRCGSLAEISNPAGLSPLLARKQL